MQTQQAREDHFEKEALRQEHRWHTLQHQFTQLQTEVQWQRQDQLSLGGVTAQDSSLPSNTAAPIHHIIRHTQGNVQGAQGTGSAEDTLKWAVAETFLPGLARHKDTATTGGRGH